MVASLDDARLLFQKWKEHLSPVRVKLRSSSLIFDATGIVTDFSPGTLEIGGDSWKFTIPLDGADFSFSDPREIPIASVRESEAAQYEFGLALDLPSGDRLALMELKGSDRQD
jgi:hypothetical protein